MKKTKITFTVLSLTLAASLAVGNITFAEKTNNSDSQMMNSDNMSGMMNMMEDSSVGNMMNIVKSPEEKKMVKRCNKFMKSSQDGEGQESKNKELKPKETSL